MEHFSGETNYIPPPLSKGQILAGIAGILDKEVVKRRPRALDLYGPYKDQEELEIDLLGTSKPARFPKTDDLPVQISGHLIPILNFLFRSIGT